MSIRLTTEQIRNLSPDPASLKAGEGLAVPQKWPSLGRSEDVVWGECQGSGAHPYRTQADLSEPAFRCSCPSRKFPCKHAIGMMLMLARDEKQFAASAPPAWVEEWMEGRRKRAEQRAVQREDKEQPKEAKEVDRAAQDRRVKARERRVAEGLADLELWLADLVRGGLAEAAGKKANYWNEPAARLVDAQAPGLARRLREMGAIVSSGEGWQARLLEKIGALHLILSGYRRISDLPEGTQSDLRAQIGWSENQEELLVQTGIVDRWAVLGSVTEEEDRLRVRRVWMRGYDSGRDALLLDFAHTSQPLEPGPQIGTELDAEMVFFPGASPLRALMKSRRGTPRPMTALPRATSIDAMEASYAAALALNPWIERFPCLLAAVVPVRRAERLLLCDGGGKALPIVGRFTKGWEMMALGGGGPIAVFGEWDGETIRPLGLWGEQNVVLNTA